MADRISEAYHVGSTVGVIAGAGVAALLFNGPWHMRIAAGLVGGLFSFVGTPLFSPLVAVGFAWIYRQLGVDPATIPADAIPGMTGFILGITGIDACRFIIERSKSLLSLLYFPKRGPLQ